MILTTKLASTLLLLISTSDAFLVEKQYLTHAKDRFNVLRYLGGNGPFVEPTGFGIPSTPPYQCTIDQAHMFMRHGERYPTGDVGRDLEELLLKLQKSESDAKGPLEFVNDYTYFAPSSTFDKAETNGEQFFIENAGLSSGYFTMSSPYDEETFTGPYAGTSDAYVLGTMLRHRYNHLVDHSKALPIFTTNMKRLYDTARIFAQGFTFNDYASDYMMVVLPESKDYGANSLTNVEACSTFDDGYLGPLVNLSLASYKQREAERLNKLSPGLDITEKDVFNMCQYCGFELNVRGTSKFCDALMPDTLVGFSYEKSVISYHNKGPGYNMSYVLGGVYVNATATLLADDSDNIGKLFFSFSHDNELLRYVTALGLFDKDEPLPVDKIELRNFFSSSEIIPMGARLITERLSCFNEKKQSEDKFVRFILNDQVIPHPKCSSGPGFSCPLEKYLQIVRDETLDYAMYCELKPGVPRHLSFFWDWENGEYPSSHFRM